MRIKAIVKFGAYEREFYIPCGNGNKSFKWLGSTASSRYAMASPHGALRSRDHYCGVSDRVQYLTLSITVPSGDNPHPAELIQDYLHDNDTVYIELCNSVPIKKVSGGPNVSSFTTLAYSVSQDHLNADLADQDADNEQPDQLDDLDDDGEISVSEVLASREAKVNFMKIVLASQLLDQKKLRRQVETIWKNIGPKIKKIHVHDHDEIQVILQEHWDIFLDLFDNYQDIDDATGNTLAHTQVGFDHFTCVLEDAGIFPAHINTSQSHLIFTHTCQLFPLSGAALRLDAFLLALVFTAQLKYNDTLDSKLLAETGKSAAADIRRLIVNYFLPLARRLECHSYLRSAFTSKECLLKVREMYETLQQSFDREALKVRDFPTTIPVENMVEMLYQAGLTASNSNQADIDKVRLLLDDVRHGTICGRDDAEDPSGRFVFPINEFCFSEFIEAVARTGYYHYSKELTMKRSDVGGDEEPSASELMLKGLQAMVDFTTGKLKKLQATAAAGKQGRGNRK